MKCLKCENEAVHFCDCLKVEHKVVSFGNSKQTTEQTTGIEQVGLCKEHLKKMIRKNHSVLAPTMPYLLAIGAMILGFILGIAGTTNSANGGGSEPLQIAGIIIAMIGIAYGLIYDFVIAYSALRKKPSKVYGRLDHEVSVMFSGNTTLYVPLEDGIYPDEKAFNRINSYLTTDIKHKIYSQLIENGVWKTGVVFATPEPQKPAAATVPDQKLSVDQVLSGLEGDNLLQASVALLLALYQRSPGGFLTSQATEVREVGRRLDEAGGMELMLQAHALFARQNPGMARNLEMVWDHIGNWQG